MSFCEISHKSFFIACLWTSASVKAVHLKISKLMKYFLHCRFLPKSPPWLLQHGNHGELKKIIATIVRINRRKLSSRLNLAITCDPSKNKKEPKASFCQVFSSVKMVKKTTSMAALW